MKKIIVLGSSIAGLAAIEEIRKSEPQSEATILSMDGSYPHDRTLFIPVLTKELDYKKILYKPNDFYGKQGIQVVTDSKVSRVNLRKKKITTEDKRPFDYDVLIIADVPNWKLPEIKGNNKTGAYSFKTLKELDQALDVLPLIETVVVQSDTLEGLRTAAAFARRGKEAVWIVSTPTILPEFLEAEQGRKAAEVLQSDKLRVICANRIAEMLGEGEVKAVRLKTGKVIAAQMVIFPEAQEDWRLLADSPLTVTGKVAVNEQLYTGLEGVFAVDRAASSENLDRASLEEQGRVAARALKGETAAFRWPIAQQLLTFPGLDINFLGRLPAAGHPQSYAAFDTASLTGKKVFLEDGQAVGAFLLNAAADTGRVTRLLQGTTTLDDFPELTATASAIVTGEKP
ncbi:MAG: FAD-dependent oxidoreductase [Candidatus Omnitrophica bacterium]|nr:FAD-dependent oxidoreductase [Candidatus Omnitrophota bacterium]